MTRHTITFIALALLLGAPRMVPGKDDDHILRVFIFAGQSNMVGSDSKVKDIERFPPFAGLDKPQAAVKFS